MEHGFGNQPSCFAVGGYPTFSTGTGGLQLSISGPGTLAGGLYELRYDATGEHDIGSNGIGAWPSSIGNSDVSGSNIQLALNFISSSPTAQQQELSNSKRKTWEQERLPSTQGQAAFFSKF